MNKHVLEELLIMEVEAHPIIYDKSRADRKIKGNVDKAWQEIAAVMNEDEIFVKKKWKNLYDTFRAKHREIMLRPSGAEGGKKKEWVFYRKLMFLHHYIQITGTESNYYVEPTPGGHPSSSGYAESDGLCNEVLRVEMISEGQRHQNENPSVEEVSIDEFPMTSAQKRRWEQKNKEHVSNKILKALDNIGKENEVPIAAESESSIRQFFTSLATKAETLSEYDQHILEISCLQCYSALKFPKEVVNEVEQ